MPNLKIILVTFSLLIPCSLPSNAQTSLPSDTNLPAVRENPQRIPEPETLPPLEELFPPVQTDPNRSQSPGTIIPEQIIVSDFSVVGSTVFSREELEEVLADYRGKPISFAQLLKAQEAVTRLYVEKGYITSGAFIPPQSLQNGVVLIQVIEGSVEEIEIMGLKRLDPSYVRSRIEIAITPPLNQNKLLNALQLLQLDPLIENLSVELGAGPRPGISILEVRVREADTKAVRLSTDNQRSPGVGSVRRKVELSFNNVLGIGDRLGVGYINTEGSNSLDNLSYSIPINPRNGTLSFSHSHTESRIIEEPFDAINIESKTLNYELTYRQPLWQTPSEEFTLGLTGSHQDSATTILDNIPFPLSEGSTDDGKTKISALRFFQEYTNRDNRQVLAFRSQFSLGVDAFNSNLNSGDEPDSDFLAWRGQGQYLRLLNKSGLTLLLRTDVQLTPHALVPLEKFSVGGQLSVRGYRQDVLLEDNGVFASAELRVPILRISDLDTTVQLTPFFDFGTAWDSDGEETREENTIYSLGVGLRFNVGDDFNARVDYGIPLVEIDTPGDTLQEKGFYFQVEYSPF